MKFFGKTALAVVVLCASTLLFAAPTKIILWHAMTGSLGTALDQIIKNYNHSQSRFIVLARYKGDYFETLNTTIAAFRAGQQPDMVQIFEAGTATMSHPPGAVVPVYKVMAMAGKQFKPKIFIPAIHDYYADQKGRLLALPFNASAAVMYYNKSAFKKAGLDPNIPPKTWPDLERAARLLLQAGYPCGFTTAWPSWIQLETFSAWHNLSFANRDNGLSGLASRVNFDNPFVRHHIKQFTIWQRQHIFQYGGRNDNATMLFTSGHCPILFQSSGALMSLRSMTSFRVGVAAIPYWPQVKGAPYTAFVGGGALWVMSGKPKMTYLAIADFISYLAKAHVQFQWQSSTGYLPITQAAYQYSKTKNFYKTHPGVDVAIRELMINPTTKNSRGLRLGNYAKIRDNNNDALEAVWSGKISAKAAIIQAINENNIVLERFCKSSGASCSQTRAAHGDNLRYG